MSGVEETIRKVAEFAENRVAVAGSDQLGLQVGENASLGTRGLQIGTGRRTGLEAAVDEFSDDSAHGDTYVGADWDGVYAGAELDAKATARDGDSFERRGVEARTEIQADYDGEVNVSGEVEYGRESYNADTGVSSETAYGARLDTGGSSGLYARRSYEDVRVEGEEGGFRRVYGEVGAQAGTDSFAWGRGALEVDAPNMAGDFVDAVSIEGVANTRGGLAVRAAVAKDVSFDVPLVSQDIDATVTAGVQTGDTKGTDFESGGISTGGTGPFVSVRVPFG